MKKYLLSAVIVSLFCISAHAQEVATFEDLSLDTDQVWDGSDESAMFTSGGYTFVNNYVDWGGYSSWDGFAYSSMTSTSYSALSDQYNSCVGHGVFNSNTYGVAYYASYMGTEPTVIASDASSFEAKGCYVTNAAYAYTSMVNGDSFSKKFDETDWFLLTATGYLENEKTGSVDLYLAKDGTILNDWVYFDLSNLGNVDEIHFTLTSSDTGTWGMNTPAYFCIDNFGADATTTNLHAIQTDSNSQTLYNLNGTMSLQATGIQIINGKVCFKK